MVSSLFGYRKTTGWTGTPGIKAPGLKVIRQLLFVQVPSGKIIICGHAPFDCARLRISSTVFLRESWSDRDTNTGRMYLIRVPQIGMSLLSAFITMDDIVMVTGMASK